MTHSPVGIQLLFLFWLSALLCQAQDQRTLHLISPQSPGWTTVAEGTTIKAQFRAVSNPADSLRYVIAQGRLDGMTLDSAGMFTWTPDFNLVDRLEPAKKLPMLVEVHNQRGETASQTTTFTVQHVNRPPVVNELRPFYVQYRTQNIYKMDAELVHDDDKDPIVFVAIPDQMPEGCKLTSQGELAWTPSLTQFNRLKVKPIYVEFWVEDQPAKTRTKGRLKVEATAMDLPPDVAVVPKDPTVRIRENGTVNLKFYVSDPNGDDDITTFGFLSGSQQVPKSALVANTPNQHEFIWTPGYDFVKDPLDSVSFQVVFYALDKAQNREERKVNFTIYNAVNEGEKDRYIYAQYRQSMVTAWNLIEQLEAKEEQLKLDYRRAKKGKRNRSVTNVSLGAITGVSPAINSSNAKYISTVGGTAIATLGALEATEVIGKSMKDLLDRYNYVLGKKSELQNKGDVFAREFALKSSRRSPEFIKRVDDFRAATSLSGLVALEVDANWESKKEATDKAIKRRFKDFSPLDETQ
ncbi:MAG: hypothetical protein H7Z72_14850 [Bacteroidetes bacterium]|nr:hypothetical protein [Fibrella sp.]